MPRIVSVDDEFNLPDVVNVRDSNLPANLQPAALSATYVRFEDEAGNPLPTRNVVIKVDSTSGEILDIVSEA